MNRKTELSSDLSRWGRAIEQGLFGVWDLDPRMELVHYSPRWKEHLGFANAGAPDHTSFWRCRVHPDDLAGMMRALRSHIEGFSKRYEARFRLRSNGSGYRVMQARGVAVERDAEGNALRLIGSLVDLTDRPALPPRELLVDPLWSGDGVGQSLPFHRVLESRARDRDGLLDQAAELLDLSLQQTASKA
ncbi:PAS domain-containing protein [Pelomonas sp. SE-A7]|uniref:PAS domain-containing protein n=1 Tax=Pelomonas sp. SE-A7 TaxID=3054953 RepID=UPI00259CD2A7|nr:PAS domain-containing protein [Pelomonas sp. SE-A7]MDM4765206.1 PAS domain-containing protein [Pelomonas sp. SE-A7]